ncbi:MAG: DUF262 domain-containing protein [Neisseriaceae bacterium]|nr:MAG: DUF262 domain-containing protein [Neisseriaceae bacterium]
MLPELHQFRRQNQKIQTRIINYDLDYLFQRGLDMYVYLPTIDKFLQRPFVWTLEQQKELIKSYFLGRPIPSITIINLENKTNGCTYQVIDGKQRLLSINSFVSGLFAIELNGVEYYYNDLPEYWKKSIKGLHDIQFVEAVEEFGGNGKFTDQDKIDWFKFINCYGTPQDMEHINSLK